MYKEILDKGIFKDFLDELNSYTNAKKAITLLTLARYLVIRWYRSRGYSDRAISNNMGLSNTRVSAIIKKINKEYEGE